MISTASQQTGTDPTQFMSTGIYKSVHKDIQNWTVLQAWANKVEYLLWAWARRDEKGLCGLYCGGGVEVIGQFPDGSQDIAQYPVLWSSFTIRELVFFFLARKFLCILSSFTDFLDSVNCGLISKDKLVFYLYLWIT